MRRRLAALATLAATLTLPACGDDPPTLTEDEQLDISTWIVALSTYCIDPSDSDRYGRIIEGIDRMIEIYRAKPDARERASGRTMQQVLADAASTMEQCGIGKWAPEIDRALAAGP